MSLTHHKTAVAAFLDNAGALGKQIRDYNWQNTKLGPITHWPASLLHTLSIMLDSPFPMQLFWGDELLMFYNQAYVSVVPLGELPRPGLPGAKKHKAVLSQVLTTGKSIARGYQEGHYTFACSPLRSLEGKVTGVLTTGQTSKGPITEDPIQQRISENERNLRLIIMQAPVAIAIFRGPEYVTEIANPLALELWGRKSDDVIGLPILQSIPELASQGVQQLLDEVYQTGKPFAGNEIPISLMRHGKMDTAYINFVYEPLYSFEGNINGLITIGTEVTGQVNARRELENAYTQARLSKEAAQLGLFDMNLVTNTLIWDERCRELFGISHQGEVTYEKDFKEGLHPDDRERIVDIIEKVFIRSISNGDYDVEYRTIGAEDGKLRWIRAKGKVYFDSDDRPLRFIGSVLDITEQKLDDLRKNDFIGMVSHELKTPLTSLTAVSQLLTKKIGDHLDPFVGSALSTINKQLKKMSKMVNSFLNISRLESGKLMVYKENFDINVLIRECIAEIALIDVGHWFSFENNSPITLCADRDKTGLVLTNLLSNAVKYSPKGKNIRITCQQVKTTITVSVRDEGMGIKPQDIDHLFERYYRVESDHTRHISGFGIGLYLSSEIVKAHGGDIWVESEKGVGSTFYFTLPVG